MTPWLDSAYPPNASQIAQARAAGYGGWAGYFSGLNILHGWSRTDFDRVKAGGLRTLAYCSGWMDPAVMKAQSVAWQVPICLDVEGGIRGDGSWVQAWLNISSAGLYGNYWVHNGRLAAFHVLAAYPTSGDPSDASWWAQSPRPPGICAWQWAGSHSWAGIAVDSTWADDGFPVGFGGGINALEEDMNRSVIFGLVRLALAAFQGPDHNPPDDPGTDAIIIALAGKIAADGSNFDTVMREFLSDPNSQPWVQAAANLRADRYALKSQLPATPSDDDSAFALKAHVHKTEATTSGPAL